MRSPRYVITLVHGTFARNADWVQPTSALTRTLLTDLPGGAVITTFPWSGRNSQNDRVAAGKELQNQILMQHKRYPDARQILIGHSHGGNVALYSFGDGSLESIVDCVICLNTPFIGATRRNTQNITLGLILPFALAMILVLPLTFLSFLPALLDPVNRGVEIRWGGWARFVTLSNEPLLTLIALSVAGLILYGLYWLAARGWQNRYRIDNWFQAKREEMISRIELPTIKKSRIFCLWSASDEVYGVFSFMEALSSIPHMLLHVAVGATIATMAAAGVLFFFSWHGIMALPRLFQYQLLDVASLVRSGVLTLMIFVAPFYFGLIAFVIYAATMSTAAIVLNFVLRIVPMGVHMNQIFDSFFVRLSFSLVPITARHVEFRDIALRYRLVNHSAAYQDPQTIELIVKFILRADQKSSSK